MICVRKYIIVIILRASVADRRPLQVIFAYICSKPNSSDYCYMIFTSYSLSLISLVFLISLVSKLLGNLLVFIFCPSAVCCPPLFSHFITSATFIYFLIFSFNPSPLWSTIFSPYLYMRRLRPLYLLASTRP